MVNGVYERDYTVNGVYGRECVVVHILGNVPRSSSRCFAFTDHRKQLKEAVKPVQSIKA